jgi:hypothetical protein
MCRGFSGLDSGVIGTSDGNSCRNSTTGGRAVGCGGSSGIAWGGFFIDRIFFWGLILAFTDDCLLVGDV